MHGDGIMRQDDAKPLARFYAWALPSDQLDPSAQPVPHPGDSITCATPLACYRPVASAGKIGGWISVVFTFMTLFNATLMYFFKPEVLKYRAVLGHMVQRVGKAVTGRLPNSSSSPDLHTNSSDGGIPHLENTYMVRPPIQPQLGATLPQRSQRKRRCYASSTANNAHVRRARLGFVRHRPPPLLAAVCVLCDVHASDGIFCRRPGPCFVRSPGRAAGSLQYGSTEGAGAAVTLMLHVRLWDWHPGARWQVAAGGGQPSTVASLRVFVAATPQLQLRRVHVPATVLSGCLF